LVDPQIQAARGDFMQMRLPEMCARLFDQADVCPVTPAELVAQTGGEFQSTGTAADDDDPMQRSGTGPFPDRSVRLLAAETLSGAASDAKGRVRIHRHLRNLDCHVIFPGVQDL